MNIYYSLHEHYSRSENGRSVGRRVSSRISSVQFSLFDSIQTVT